MSYSSLWFRACSSGNVSFLLVCNRSRLQRDWLVEIRIQVDNKQKPEILSSYANICLQSVYRELH